MTGTVFHTNHILESSCTCSLDFSKNSFATAPVKEIDHMWKCGPLENYLP